LVCAECGEGNAATRKFCSRCGNSLAEAERVRQSWWRRLMPRRRRRTHEAGSRPGRRGFKLPLIHRISWGKLVKPVRLVAALVGLALALAYSTVPAFHDWSNQQVSSTKQRVLGVVRPKLVAVNPVKVSGTTAIKGHPVTAAFDGYRNTFWATIASAVEPTATLTFQESVDLSRAIVRIGDPDKFQTTHRPKQLHFVYSNGKTWDVELNDTPDPQTVKLKNGGNVRSVEIHVVSVYRSVRGKTMTLSEIELFAKK
jgi:hypothetical protein